jgi:phosphoserine phosphatase
VQRQEVMAMLARVNLTGTVAFRGPMMAARRYLPALGVRLAAAVARGDGAQDLAALGG